MQVPTNKAAPPLGKLPVPLTSAAVKAAEGFMVFARREYPLYRPGGGGLGFAWVKDLAGIQALYLKENHRPYSSVFPMESMGVFPVRTGKEHYRSSDAEVVLNLGPVNGSVLAGFSHIELLGWDLSVYENTQMELF